MSVVEAVTVAPEAPTGLVVDVKQNGRIRARIEQLGGAWRLVVFGPDWTVNCADIVDAYEQYENTCRLAGVPVDHEDLLTVVEIYQPRRVEHGATGQHRPRRTQVAQVVQQQDCTWRLTVFGPAWSRDCPTVVNALQTFTTHSTPQPQRGPVGGR